MTTGFGASSVAAVAVAHVPSDSSYLVAVHPSVVHSAFISFPPLVVEATSTIVPVYAEKSSGTGSSGVLHSLSVKVSTLKVEASPQVFGGVSSAETERIARAAMEMN